MPCSEVSGVPPKKGEAAHLDNGRVEFDGFVGIHERQTVVFEFNLSLHIDAISI